MRLSRLPLRALATSVVALSALSSPCWAILPFNDPPEDTFGSPNVPHDLANVDGMTLAGAASILLDFYDEVAAPSAFSPQSVVGYLDIDLDQDPTTGVQSNISRLHPNGASGLGVEFYVDLFSERFSPGYAEILDALTAEVVGLATVAYGPKRVTVDIPLSALRGDGVFNYGVIIGDYLDMSDIASPRTMVPEPSGVAVASAACLLAARRRRSVLSR